MLKAGFRGLELRCLRSAVRARAWKPQRGLASDAADAGDQEAAGGTRVAYGRACVRQRQIDSQDGVNRGTFLLAGGSAGDVEAPVGCAAFLGRRAGMKQRKAGGRVVRTGLVRRIRMNVRVDACLRRILTGEAPTTPAHRKGRADRDENEYDRTAHYRSTRGRTLARRTDVVAAVGVVLKSPNWSDSVDPIRVPPAKYVPESEPGRMS